MFIKSDNLIENGEINEGEKYNSNIIEIFLQFDKMDKQMRKLVKEKEEAIYLTKKTSNNLKEIEEKFEIASERLNNCTKNYNQLIKENEKIKDKNNYLLNENQLVIKELNIKKSDIKNVKENYLIIKNQLNEVQFLSKRSNSVNSNNSSYEENIKVLK